MANEIMKQRSARMKELKAEWKKLADGSQELNENLREYASLYNANQSDTYQKLGGRLPEQMNLITNENNLVYLLEIKPA